jgi:flagella synthesis protein FlgN
MNNNIKTLSSLLEQEINWIDALNILLVEEKEVLATRQFNQLEEFANKKQELSSQLEESAKQRMLLINPTNANQSAHLALKEFLQNCSAEEVTQIDALNNKLVELLARCRELNTVNGQVIANNLYVRQEIVNTLTGNKADAVDVYTANGNIQSSNNARHHQEA